MSSPPVARATFPAVILLAALALCACTGGSTALRVSTVTPRPEAPTAARSTTVTPPPAAATATATLSSSPTAASTAVPTSPPPTAAPTGGLSFEPAQIEQGGVAVVYLNEPAGGATLRFGGQQYPMLPDAGRWWAIVGVGAFASPGLAPVSVTYTPVLGGPATSIAQSIQIVDRDYPVENIDLDAQTSTLLAPDIISAELAQRASIYAGFTPQRLWSGPFQRPSSAAIGDFYGIARGYNRAPATDYHRGTDFVARTGDPITAAAAGRVVFTGPLRVRGGSVVIDHGVGVFTAYHHLSQVDVAQGQLVRPGDQLGLAGSTGLVTGPHLHWEVIVRGVEVDGQIWLQNDIGP